MAEYSDFYEVDDDFDEAYADFDEADDDFDDDYESLLDTIEYLDDEDAEFLNTLLNPVGTLLNPARAIGSLLGTARGRSTPKLPPTPPIRRYPSGGITRASTRRPSPVFNRSGLVTTPTFNRVQTALKRQIAKNSQGISVLNKRAKVINKNVNNTKAYAVEAVKKLNRADKTQQRAIQSVSRSARKLGKDLDSVRQTSILLTLLGGGEQEYDVVGEPEYESVVELVPQETGGNVELVAMAKDRLKSIKLEPKGSNDDLLPLVLLSGGLGGSSKSGGIDPLLLILLMRD